MSLIESSMAAPPSSPASLVTLEPLSGFPETLTSQQPSPLPPASGDLDLRALLQALLTRMDIEALVYRLEEVHLREIHLVWVDAQLLSDIYG